MEPATCSNCSSEIYPTAIFCHKCGHRLKCEKCGAILIKDANNCISCGKKIADEGNITNASMNTMTYRKTKDEIFCDVSLTDGVAKDGIGTLIANITNNRLPEAKFSKKDIEGLGEQKNNNNSDTLDIDSEEVIYKETGKKDVSEDFPHISDVEMNVYCSEPEWIAIYAFYESAFSKKTFSKKTVYDRYMQKRKSDSHLANFSKNWKSLFKEYFSTISDDEIKFKNEKLSHLQNIILNKEKGTVRTFSRRKANTKNVKANETLPKEDIKNTVKKVRSKSNGQGHTLITSLNLYPKDKKSLKEFYNQYSTQNTSEVILIIVYYVEKVIELKNIDINTIYTCYKDIGIPVPVITSALDNINKRNGYVNTSNRSDLTVTIKGENHIEHQMKKL